MFGEDEIFFKWDIVQLKIKEFNPVTDDFRFLKLVGHLKKSTMLYYKSLTLAVSLFHDSISPKYIYMYSRIHNIIHVDTGSFWFKQNGNFWFKQDFEFMWHQILKGMQKQTSQEL